jgi:hypothetical protein
MFIAIVNNNFILVRQSSKSTKLPVLGAILVDLPVAFMAPPRGCSHCVFFGLVAGAAFLRVSLQCSVYVCVLRVGGTNGLRVGSG